MLSVNIRGGHARFQPASRLGSIAVSEILAITAEANARKRAGRPMIILGTGEPDFDTPDNIKSAAERAMWRGATKYTALDGAPDLKAAIREKFLRENNLEFGLNEITCSAGAKQILYNAFMATLNEGDEVIIPAPYWTSYADIVTISGGIPVIVRSYEDNGFRLTAEQLEQAITPSTRWVLLNSPSNPSGAAYGSSELKQLADVLLRHPRVWTLSDDIYEHIIYDGFEFATMAAVEPRLRDRILTVNGVSKAYAMTGWRIGYGAGPAPLIQAMAIVQSQSTSCPSSISQAAAVEALTGPQDILAVRRNAFRDRRDIVVAALNGIAGINCRVPQGAFYTFASCAGLLGKRTLDGGVLKSDADFCRYLMDAVDVAVVPGSCFGLAPFFRISYATSEGELSEACKRIYSACHALQ
jgi:aspartate aminotransferase